MTVKENGETPGGPSDQDAVLTPSDGKKKERMSGWKHFTRQYSYKES